MLNIDSGAALGPADNDRDLRTDVGSMASPLARMQQGRQHGGSVNAPLSEDCPWPSPAIVGLIESL